MIFNTDFNLVNFLRKRLTALFNYFIIFLISISFVQLLAVIYIGEQKSRGCVIGGEFMVEKISRVGLAKAESRRQSVFASLDYVRVDIESKIRNQVLLKPNFLTSKNQLASTHIDSIRGTIDFLKSVKNPPDEIIIAEGGNEAYSGEAFKNFGYHNLEDEFGISVRLIDLNLETNWVETPIITAVEERERNVRMPKIVLDCPCTISIAVAKTHDVCVVTLAQKNLIMGTLHRDDRIWMHGFSSHAERILPDEARILNANLIRVSKHLKADIGIIDGTVGLQGNGPGGTDAVPLGVAAASADVFSSDAVICKAMGFEPMEMGLLNYAQTLGVGVADLNDIDVIGASLEEITRSFLPHETTSQQLLWREQRAEEFARK